MSIILNEKKYAESVLKNGLLNKNIKDTLFILSKYYHSMGLKSNDIVDKLDDFMEGNYKNYISVDWTNQFEYYISKTKGRALVEVDSIPITKNELKTIQEIKGLELQRLAFTLLCIAKFNNMVNPNNHDWVNREFREIFSTARIKKTEVNQALMFNDLMTLRLLGYSKLPNNTNVKVKYIDTESEVVLNVIDFHNLGYEYRLYLGEKFTRCEGCGILMKPKTDLKRCAECNIIHRRDYSRIRKQLKIN